MDLNKILAWVASHGMVDPQIDGDAVTFGVELSLNGAKMPWLQWERVTTWREAREALGY